MNLPTHRSLLGLIVFGLLGGIAGPAVRAIADADKTAKSGEPKMAALKMRYLRTEHDAQGPLRVYEVQPPYPGWATGGIGTSQATVKVIKTGLEVSFIEFSSPEKRYKQVEDIPFDTRSMVITYDKGTMTFKDGSGHHYVVKPESIELH